MRRVILAALVLASGILSRPAPLLAAEDAEATRPPGRLPNVVVYLVDTLRADHLGVYGYPRDTSPALDGWAAQSVVFDRAYAPSSWTRPSVVSLMTGLDPIRHGVEDRLDVVPEGVELLSERLGAAGYTTWAAVTNPNVLPEWGLGQGFDVFEDLETTGPGTRASDVTAWVTPRLEELSRKQPFFLYLHLLDPHTPYDPPPPFDDRYPRSPALPADRSIGRYDGEVAFVDSEFGRLIGALAEHGLADDTLLVFVADHGEELMDHGSVGHGYSLFEEVVRIPLVMRLPKGARAGTRVAQAVSLVDVAPTILSQIGLAPSAGVDGRDLSPLFDDHAGEVPERELVLSLYTTGTGSHLVRGLVDGPLKYLRRWRPVESEALYDLRDDPREASDRSAAKPDARDRLAASLDARLAQSSRGVHLRVVAGPSSEPVGWEVVLRTTGRFTGASPVRLEATDRIELSDEGSVLRLQGRLENRTRAFAEGDRMIPDEDGLLFQVEPRDARVEIQRLQRADGGRIPLRAGEVPTPRELPFAFDATQADWAVRDVGELLRDGVAAPSGAAAFLGVVRDPETNASVSEAVLDRLRALGYIVPGDEEGAGEGTGHEAAP